MSSNGILTEPKRRMINILKFCVWEGTLMRKMYCTHVSNTCLSVLNNHTQNHNTGCSGVDGMSASQDIMDQEGTCYVWKVRLLRFCGREKYVGGLFHGLWETEREEMEAGTEGWSHDLWQGAHWEDFQGTDALWAVGREMDSHRSDHLIPWPPG